MISRATFLIEALSYLLTPYIYGAKGDIVLVNGAWTQVPKDPATGRQRALDCSGVPTTALFNCGGPDLRRTYYTDVFWADGATRGRRDVPYKPNPQFPVETNPQPGDLALYGGAEGDVEHVMVVLNSVNGVHMVFGAAGGGSHTLSYADAARDRACVKVRASHLYRPDFRGFRSMCNFLGQEK